MVTDTMNAEILKEDGARTQSPESSGTQCAEQISTADYKIVSTGSPFVRAGSVSMENAAVRIDYEAFGQSHTVFIGLKDHTQLIRDRFAPAAPVKESRTGTDGKEECVKIGYAARTASGKALKVNTIHSGGDLVVSWGNFLKVVKGSLRTTSISRIAGGPQRQPPKPAPAPAPARSIYSGLERGF